MVDNNNNVPAGWYDDASDPTIQRWWDGQAWTSNTTPKVVAPSGAPAPQVQNAVPNPNVAPDNGFGSPQQGTPWTNAANAPAAKPNNKLVIIIGAAVGGLVLLIGAIVLIVSILGGANNNTVEPLPGGDGGTTPSETSEPAEPAPVEPEEPTGTTYADSDPSTNSPFETALINAAQDYLADLDVPAMTDTEILDAGYSACNAVQGGMDKDGFFAFITENASTPDQAQALGFLFGAGVSALCPEHTQTVSSWV